jgi:hypothetical protein
LLRSSPAQGDGIEQGADNRQRMHMLMAVDEVRQAAQLLAELVDLAQQAVAQGGTWQQAQLTEQQPVRQRLARRILLAEIVGQIEMQADIRLRLHLAQRCCQCGPVRRLCHHAGGRQAATLQQVQECPG